MQTKDYIPLEQLCLQYNLERDFFMESHDFGLIEFEIIDGIQFIPIEKVKDIETILRLRLELDINMEGIGAVLHLLKKMDIMAQELSILRNKVQEYECSW